MDQHPIQGGVAILLVASCYGKRDKFRPDGPLGSYTDFTFTYLPLICFTNQYIEREGFHFSVKQTLRGFVGDHSGQYSVQY